MGLLAKSLFREPPSLIGAELLDTLLADYPRRDFQLRLWDGSTWGTEEQPRFTLVLKHAGALRAMFLSPSELTIGEAYVYDDFDIEGDIEAAFDLADYLLGQDRSLWESFDLNERLQKLPVSDRPRAGPHPIELWGAVHSKDATNKPSPITTIFPSSSTRSGWISAWSTRALISTRRKKI